MRRLPDGRISEMYVLLCSLPARAELADTFFPPQAGRVLPGVICAALADRAGPASDYTSPPEISHKQAEACVYADAMIRRDQRARDEGRPEHDLDTFGRPLRPGS